MKIPTIILTGLTAACLLAPCHAARQGTMEKPDFTKGDTIPEGANHDWTLGATGARGWIYSEKMVTSDARQIKITKVDKGSPADNKLAVGDVILGVGGKPFSYDPRIEFGKALTLAETEAGGGKLALTRWKDGKTEEVVVEIPVLGTYGATSPFDCEKSKRILEQGCEALAKRMETDPNYHRQTSITRSLNAIALLASGNEKYKDLVRREALWAKDFSAESMATWYYGYVMMLLAEYKMATGDDSVMSGLERIAMEASNGQSIVGSWGHKFAGDDGRLVGYGMMNAPGVPLTTGLVMARMAGVKNPKLDEAIEKSAKLIRFYENKGSIPYGDHAPWTQTHDDNGKNGMAAVLFSLLDETSKAEYFSRMSVACHGNERDTGHTGNFWNITWAMPGVAQSGPNATGAWMKEFGAWSFDLARRWNGTFIHQGPPQMKTDSTKNWDSTGAYLIAYAMPLKHIMLTGKRPTKVPQMDAAEAQRVVNDGKGWNNKDRLKAYEELSTEMLFESLASWSPVIRGRAASVLAKRQKDFPVSSLVKMLDSSDLNARYGACEALQQIQGAAAPALPTLLKTLDHEDLWLRIKAAEAIASMGDAGTKALPKLLAMLAKGPSAADPRAMEQRYLSFAVFGQMLKRSIKGADPELLRKAVAAGLQNQDGRSRGAVSSVYDKFAYEEIEPLLPAIHEAVVKPAPSGIMFAAQVRVAGLQLLAKHKIREGIPLCVEVMEIDKWGKAGRIPQCIKALEDYGVAAKAELPRLKQLEKDLSSHREAKNLKTHIDRLQSLITKLEGATGTVELRSLN